MQRIQTKNQTLPDEVRSALRSITGMSERAAYIKALRAAGWTTKSIGEALGVSSERARQIAGAPVAADVDGMKYPVPNPPAREEKVKTPRVYVEPDPDVLARLKELQPLAALVRGNGGAYRAEAEEYVRLLAEQHLEHGVPVYRLAKRLGVTHAAVRSRLVRYGYIEPKKGKSKAYTRILQENRLDGVADSSDGVIE